ncbi:MULTISPECIES: putative Ig domain-containing protein [Symbiopectobacterium]|uniref:putative Ig domain-containing protein n=1 Tax=Symbiopectobacterium TaxID=801 RepID=UPI001A2B480B|nr:MULTISPECIES: putative Ig domain-containing protein [Symbiopectobacterium]MBG6248097.1 hypothetical protein [Candidatus Symbiopectobacterium sp. PLON1]MBT9430623.1 putative Ig domain-containing protein [Candidatus Symbiopectobacterium endolongispinus]
MSAPVNDESSYQGATLVIERTGGAQVGDRLGLSAGSGLTLAEDGKISLGDKAIANATTDANGKLALTFLAGVTQAEAQQVLRAITYQSTSNDQTAAGTEATFRINFNDGQNHTAEFTTVVNLVGINDPAVVSTELVNSTYVPGNGAITLFKNTIIDTIETGQKIHRVEISVSPASVGDVLHVEGGEILLDKTIDYQAFVGESGMEYRVSVSKGVATVTLYVARDVARTAQLIDGITYSHNDADATGSRTVGLTVYEEGDWRQDLKTEFSEKTVITFKGSDVPENSAPVYNDNAGLNLGTLQAGSAYHYTLPENLLTDADNDTLTWSVSGLPDGLSFDAQTRTISGTPTASSEFTVTITASDGNAQATHSVNVSVAQAPVAPQPETPDSTTPAPVILTTSSANVPDVLKEREQEQPLSTIIAALSQTPSPTAAHTLLPAEFAAAQPYSAAERTAAPWVLDPVMQTLLPSLETVNFATRGNPVQHDNTPGRVTDSSLFQRVPGQTSSLESAYSSLQGSLQLANGRPLPAWIQFDARNGQLRITDPDAVQVNQIQLALTAQAADGARRTIPVTLQTGHETSTNQPTDRGASTALPPLAAESVQDSRIEIALPTGKTAFSEQFSAPRAGQDALLAALSELSRLRA